MNKTLASMLLATAALLAGCVGVVKIEGDQVINNRMAIKVTDAWNKVNLPGNRQPFEAWTQEGITLDQLRMWAAVAPGQSLVAAPTSAPPAGQKAALLPTFRAGMPPDQLVNLFERMFSIDGSVVTLGKVEPAPFAGEPGVRFEFSVARKSDDVQLRGMGWIMVRNNELYAASFTAPRLGFFANLLPKAEAIVATARVKS
jgi:hypothetical protein